MFFANLLDSGVDGVSETLVKVLLLLGLRHLGDGQFGNLRQLDGFPQLRIFVEDVRESGTFGVVQLRTQCNFATNVGGYGVVCYGLIFVKQRFGDIRVRGLGSYGGVSR